MRLRIPVRRERWEYDLLILRDLGTEDNRLRLLNERGRSGWELAGVHSVGNQIHYLFKRLLSGMGYAKATE